MDNADVEQAARQLLTSMWEQRHILVPERAVGPLAVADPALAARHLFIDFRIEEQIGGPFAYRGQKFETAGLLDRQARKIAVSQRFPREVMVFTAAHEIGHWILHAGAVVMHRDRPVAWPPASGPTRERIEREADYFAACFLMPRGLVKKAVEELFGACPLVLDDRTAFAIDPADYELILKARKGSLERARAVARARRIGLRQFEPLHRQFGVSVSAMAYRLQELSYVH